MDSSRPHGPPHARLPCPSPSPGVCSDSPQAPPSRPLSLSLHSQQQPSRRDRSTSLGSSSQPLRLPGDLRPCPGCVWLRQGLSDSQTSCFTLSLKYFSSDSDNCPHVGIGRLLQCPHLPKEFSVLLTLPFSRLVPSFFRVLRGSIYSFPVVRYFCPLSAGILQTLLCLKVYSWCIYGERCTPCPPTPLPSCSSPAQTHVRWVGDALQLSHPLLPTSPALSFSQLQGLFQWVSSLH